MEEEQKSEEKEFGGGDEVRIYEIGYLLVSGIGDEGVPSAVADIRDSLARQGGITISEDLPTLKHISYIMEKMSAGVKHKHDRAYFGWIKFEMLPENLLQLKKEIESKEDMLRSMIIQTVRENTMLPPRSLSVKRPEGQEQKRLNREGSQEIVSEAPAMTEEELDKTIEELVIE